MESRSVLFIYPHPDDESFGPAGAMHFLTRCGYEVNLLTLTRGESTKIRFDLGVNKEEMGRIRSKEMEKVAKTLNLADLTILDFPDGHLKELDPRELEWAIEQHIRLKEPEVVVTYPVHGISGFHDHLVTHACVKNAYCRLREEQNTSLRRLAFIAISEDDKPEKTFFDLHSSTKEEIDCRLQIVEADFEAHQRALDCYETYATVIEKTGIKEIIGMQHDFEFFQERFDPPVKDLFDGLK
jgi:LmbE family N-acetylglucosaminyl deacetylase